MLKLKNKTPVSYLQEQLLLKHICPKYELIFNGVGIKPPKFTFRVQVGNLSQEGSGKNKQEAKHKAAENMLIALNLIDDEKSHDDSSDFLQENHIGNLKEFCFAQNYPDPVYHTEETAGPPHSKIFKVVCSVSHIQEDGTSRTKKSAKHIAASKMLNKLKQCAVQEGLAPKETVIIPEVVLTPEEISEKYKNSKSVSVLSVQNPLMFYRDHHSAFLNLHEESPTLAKLLDGTLAVDSENSVQLVEDIAKELKVKLSICTDLVSKDVEKDLVLVSMGLTPVISEIGCSYQNATFKLLRTLLVLAKSKPSCW